MKKETLQETEINIYIEQFKKEFHKKFGIIPTVGCRYVKPTAITLERMEILTNKVLRTMAIANKCSHGIRTKVRFKELIILRQCMFKIVRDMGYSSVHIAEFYGFNHATVLYSCNVINNMTQTKDELLIPILNKLKNVIEEEYGYDGDVSDHNRSGLIS